jgi:hypothetical protein
VWRQTVSSNSCWPMRHGLRGGMWHPGVMLAPRDEDTVCLHLRFSKLMREFTSRGEWRGEHSPRDKNTHLGALGRGKLACGCRATWMYSVQIMWYDNVRPYGGECFFSQIQSNAAPSPYLESWRSRIRWSSFRLIHSHSKQKPGIKFISSIFGQKVCG